MIWVFENMNIQEGINKECVDFYPEEKWKCFFAEYVIPFIKIPIFPLQSKYDSWQIKNVLGDENEETLINDFGEELMIKLQKSLFADKKNSGFFDACLHHTANQCGKMNEKCNLWNSMHISNVTENQAFSLWYNEVEKNPLISDAEFPCHRCCI